LVLLHDLYPNQYSYYMFPRAYFTLRAHTIFFFCVIYV